MAFPHTIPRSPFAFVLHLVAFASISWSFNELWKPSPMSDFMDSSYGGHWQYLTILSLAIAWLTFLFSLLYDILPLSVFARLKTSVAVLAVPVEGLVGLLYWTLTVVNPALLNPSLGEGKEPFRIPFWLDVSLHGLPAVFLWLDFLLFSPPFPTRARPALLSSLAAAAYVFWLEHAAAKNGRYAYPMLDEWTPVQRSVFYVMQIPVLIALYKLANGIHRLVRGEPDVRNEAKHVERAERKVGAKKGQ
ncbi:hypothetical protein NBRC10512_001926 [Rhodotorula toruloides]|uniref:RHTO0S03e12244g1_1 n=2 Tax=Rhodotorula toruloides TaxID=5286 RepID=A0A061ANG7_RHOTO|nr:protein of FAR-17a/AIG1-like protein family [Rhodotorula toruloides NP11]EMS26147.1 protein of FAR-17a/AIG1-like protein family [Rhodotorula toruloides NP11]CDR38692.1 RHTO0S03e12244g1_1 [Rhodotorula toruloides]